MRFLKHALLSCVLAGALSTAGLLTPISAMAQSTESEISAVHAYVARTREVSTADYQIEAMPDKDNLHVYRITLSSGVERVAPAERIFEVTVSASTGQVAGEYAVLPTN